MYPQSPYAIEQREMVHPMPETVSCLLREVAPVFSGTGCLDVLNLFVIDVSLYSLAVIDAHYKPVGIVNRHRLIDIFIGPYARDLYCKKSILDFMDKTPIVVEEDTSIDDLARIIIDAGMRHMVNGYILTRKGIYIGMGNGHDLLDLITRRRQAHLYQLAHYDQLTQLPNRLLFEDRLQRACLNARRNNLPVALLFIDLDRFKFVNDTFGHLAGDLLLKAVAQRLQSAVRKSDTVARLSGDEFTIILETVNNSEQALAVAEKIIAILAQSFCILEHDVYVGASIGVALFPEHDDSPEGLIRKADAAMYKAKTDFRGRSLLYAERMDEGALERLALEGGLRTALEQGEFELYYQPQCCTQTGELLGVEALVRWHHPQLGLVSPVKFIPIAEATGLIVRLGDWVMRTACVQHMRWRALGLPPIRVAVNISAVQFRQLDFHGAVRKAVEESGLAPQLLELELTEGIVMSDADGAIATLARLREMGLTLALDDFGTGYSSLGYLREFPLDRLKIDRCFVHGLDRIPANLAIVRTIVALGANLGIDVIAEGVETPEELALLASNGCRGVQGYYIAKPMPAADFQDWFRANSRCGRIHPASAHAFPRSMGLAHFSLPHGEGKVSSG